MKIDEQLNQVFNLPVEEVATEIEIYQENEIIEVEETSDVEDAESDFKMARVLLKDLINTNNTAIDQIGKIAITYENPKGFEVLGQLVKVQTELIKELLESHKKKRELIKPAAVAEQKIETQNNILFTGSTSELMKALANKNGSTE